MSARGLRLLGVRREEIDIDFEGAGAYGLWHIGNQSAEPFAECRTSFDHAVLLCGVTRK